jgi:hypothetical protein
MAILMKSGRAGAAGRNSGSAEVTGPRTGDGPSPRPRSSEDEKFNDQVHALMRDAAEQRELRTRTQAANDTAAARRQFDDIVALSRARGENSRSRG